MPIYTLKANETRNIPTPARYLNVLRVEGTVLAENPPVVVPFSLRTGYRLDLQSVNNLMLTNQDNTDIIVEVESNNIAIESGSGDVTIANAPEIQRIREPIAVTASATVDGGTVTINSSQVFDEINSVTIPAGQRAQIVAARNLTGRVVNLQNISATRTKLHIGKDNTIDGTKGAVLVGSIDEPAAAQFAVETAIWVFNDSSNAAVVIGFEQYVNTQAPAQVTSTQTSTATETVPSSDGSVATSGGQVGA